MKPLTEKQKNQLIAELEASELSYKDLMIECQKISSRMAAQVIISSARVDKETREILAGKNRIPLSAKEFEVFNLLHTHSNRPVERLQIAREVWGIDGTEKNHSIDVCVNHLRSKMDQAELVGYIKTVPGRGYMMDLLNPAASRAAKLETPKAAVIEAVLEDVIEPAN
jgi:DNA-binding response OmpR family regulator